MQHLLERIKDQALRTAAERCLAPAAKFEAKKAAVAKDPALTDVGRRDALRAAMLGYVRELRAAREPIDKAAKQVEARRDALKDISTDRTDLTGAIDRMEIRNLVRSMSPQDRAQLAMGTDDIRFLEAMLAAPPELSGLTGAQRELADKIEARYVALKHPDALAEIEEIEEAVAAAADIARVARGQIRNAVNMDDREFEAVAGPVERKVGAPWLIKDGARTLVCEVDQNGTASYHAASEWELAEGVTYANADEWRAARAAA